MPDLLPTQDWDRSRMRLYFLRLSPANWVENTNATIIIDEQILTLIDPDSQQNRTFYEVGLDYNPTP
jgi:hypothetical protein